MRRKESVEAVIRPVAERYPAHGKPLIKLPPLLFLVDDSNYFWIVKMD